jgi:hypothetical protein
MADLYPTKTRLKLLRGVQRNEVTYYTNSRDSFWDGEGKGRKVTGQVTELWRAEWVRIEPTAIETTPWVLTEAGRKVLEEADRGD